MASSQFAAWLLLNRPVGPWKNELASPRSAYSYIFFWTVMPWLSYLLILDKVLPRLITVENCVLRKGQHSADFVFGMQFMTCKQDFLLLTSIQHNEAAVERGLNEQENVYFLWGPFSAKGRGINSSILRQVKAKKVPLRFASGAVRIGLTIGESLHLLIQLL